MLKQFLLLLLIFQACTAQKTEVNHNNYEKYPQNYFRNPLDIPTKLSGTFGELRGNHFHAGLDYKTQQKEGFKIYTAAKGYVSRLKISDWGYGKAIYITHPNGYTTVYAHLKKFNDRIENYLKKKQYQQESYNIQLFPKKEELPIETNEIIGFSGSTGGFSDPHLHFEIRDSETEMPINPMLFGYKVTDTQKPVIKSLYAFPLGENSHVNNLGMKHKVNTYLTKKGELKSDTIKAHGEIGFGISAYDLLDGANNKNGIYSLKMYVDNQKIHEFNANTFSYNETKYINLLIDYELYKTKKERVQKCYIDQYNKLRMYDRSLNGKLNISNGKEYEVLIEVEDFAGNFQKLKIPILGKKSTQIVRKKEIKSPYKINFQQAQKFKIGKFLVNFPASTFYEDTQLQLETKKDTILEIHTPIIPLRKKFQITFDASEYPIENHKNMYIANKKPDSKYTSYKKTIIENNTLSTTVKELGTYAILEDLRPPKATIVNVKENQWISNSKYLKVQIEDSESGILNYRATINGKWILMEYDLKNKEIVYDFSDLKFKPKHDFTLSVTDNAGNTTTIKRSFFRKE